MEKITKNYLLVTIKLLITAAFISWLYLHADRDSIRQSLVLIQPMQLLVAACLHIGVFLLGAGRWWLLLKRAGISTPFRKVMPSYYLGVFFNNLLPTSMGGDVIRTLHLKLRGLSTKVLVGSAMIDRFIGLATVVVMGTISIVFAPDIKLSTGNRVLMLVLTVLIFALLWLMLTGTFIRLIERWAHRYNHTRIRKALLDVVVLCYSYRSAKHIILQAFGITLMLQALVILIYYYLGTGIGIHLPLITYFAIIPVVFLAASIPISIGGLGVREGALVGLLISAGIDLQHAIALSLLYLLVLWLSSLPGAIVLLFGARQKNQSLPMRS